MRGGPAGRGCGAGAADGGRCGRPRALTALTAPRTDLEVTEPRFRRAGNPGATPLYAAAFAGSYRCVALMCEAGARVNARTANGAVLSTATRE